MPTPSMTAEQKQEAVDALEKYGSQTAAAEALGLKRQTFQSRLYAGIKAGLDQAIVHPAPQGHTVKGVSTFYRGDGTVAAQWVKTRVGEPSVEDLLDAIRTGLDDYAGRSPPIAEPDFVDPELATVFPVSDAHFGLYAWGKEAGEDYDLEIADATNRAAFARLMAATPRSECAVVLGLGDLLHADDTTNRTARSGNALDVDSRHAKVMRVAVLYMVHCVELALTKHRHVIVRNLPGNHDLHSASAVTMALWAWFRDEPRVTVDTDPSYFWWWSWGNVLMGATHGDMAKMADLPLIMAASRPEDWGRAKHRHAFCGHVHHKSAIETGGVIVESFQSTAARDAWHSASGFRSGRSMSALVFHNLHGEIARQKVNILSA
jgi:hypothetical protein